MTTPSSTYAGYREVVALVKGHNRPHHGFVWLRNGPVRTSTLARMRRATRIMAQAMVAVVISSFINIAFFDSLLSDIIHGSLFLSLLACWALTHGVLARRQSMSLELAFRMGAVAVAAENLPRREYRAVMRTLRTLGGSIKVPHSISPLDITPAKDLALRSLEERVKPRRPEMPALASDEFVTVTALSTSDIPLARIRRGDREVSLEYHDGDFWKQMTSCCFNVPGPNLDAGWGCACGTPHMVPESLESGETASEDVVVKLRGYLGLTPLDEAVIMNDLERVADAWQKHWEENPAPMDVYVNSLVLANAGKAWGL